VTSKPYAVTKLEIWLHISDEDRPHEVLAGLPHYSRESFAEQSPNYWYGDFVVSCPVAPELAEGDFVDDLGPYFPALLSLHQFHQATFRLQISVGEPGPDEFELSSQMVALIAALGADLRVSTSTNPLRVQPVPLDD
jgi:hypothetical protein